MLACGVQFHATTIHESFATLQGVYNLNRADATALIKACEEIVKEKSEAKCVMYVFLFLISFI